MCYSILLLAIYSTGHYISMRFLFSVLCFWFFFFFFNINKIYKFLQIMFTHLSLIFHVSFCLFVLFWEKKTFIERDFHLDHFTFRLFLHHFRFTSILSITKQFHFCFYCSLYSVSYFFVFFLFGSVWFGASANVYVGFMPPIVDTMFVCELFILCYPRFRQFIFRLLH